MGIFRGRHQEVMGETAYQRAKEQGRLPDILVGTVDETPPIDPAELHIPTTLPSEVTRRIIEDMFSSTL
jgi:hypothetical protein